MKLKEDIRRCAGGLFLEGLRTSLLVLLTAAWFGSSTFIEAAPLRFTSPVLLPEPTSPYAPTSCRPGQRFDLRFEPSIAVNPRDQKNIVAGWIQDAAAAVVSAVTHDGGRTWQRIRVPGFSACDNSDRIHHADPWLSFGGDGTLYFAALALLPGPVQLQVSRSYDGGDTWVGTPALVTPIQSQQALNDKESITAHPRQPGVVYAVWSKRYPDVLSALTFSRSTDGGQTWSAETFPYIALPGFIPVSATLLVLPDDSLVMLFTEFPILASPFIAIQPIPPPGSNIDIMAIRSTDGGTSWSTPVTIATTVPFAFSYDPEPLTDPNNPGVGTANGSDVPHIINGALAGDGTIYVSWHENANYTGIVYVARSSDGGQTWQVRTAAQINTPVYLTPVAASSDGSVAVLFHDLRNDKLGDAPLTADVWVRRSRDRGDSWDESYVATYNLRQAYDVGINQYFLGDYNSIAAAGAGSFAAVFGMGSNAQPQVFFSTSDLLPTAVSRQIHAPDVAYDVPLPLGSTPGVECRTGGKEKRFQVVLTFAGDVTLNGGNDPKASLQAPRGGTIDSVEVSYNVVTVNLSGVGDAQRLVLTLNGVTNGTDLLGDVTVPLGVLAGDTNGDGAVNSGDAQQTRNGSGQETNAGNFRSDLNRDGAINSGDASIVRKNSGNTLLQ